MYYYATSISTIEWTNQHGAGDNPLVHSEIILQYMCDDANPGIRDGSENTPIDPDDPDDVTRGMHEPIEFFRRCARRTRNKGLWLADQQLRGDTALFTRQNGAGERFGLECTEERDYYPYWHPTPWKDIAILTSNEARCEYYRAESQNVRAKGHCELTETQQATYDAATNKSQVTPQPHDAWVYNNPGECLAAGFAWLEDSAWDIEPPYCGPMPTTRDNHLGNAVQRGFDGELFAGYASVYNWTMPEPWHKEGARCVLRIRYNISTGDADFWQLNASFNGDASPLRDNPEYVVYNESGRVLRLRLQLNTDQYGRTFEDRSHVWELYPRPLGLDCRDIYNLNVRGKRGNIVQVFPAVEYDFVPERLHLSYRDCVHLQWTGSNSNPLGNDGEGQAGSDRSNFVQLENHLVNYPLNASNVTIVPPEGLPGFTFLQSVRRLAALLPDHFQGQPQLNDAGTYFDAGILKFRKGTYYYYSTRNNNFSNRSQKGVLLVDEKGQHGDDGLNGPLIAGIVIFCTICLVGAVVAWGIYGTRNPDTRLGYTWLETKEFFAGFVNH
jgi:hypothetical protein